MLIVIYIALFPGHVGGEMQPGNEANRDIFRHWLEVLSWQESSDALTTVGLGWSCKGGIQFFFSGNKIWLLALVYGVQGINLLLTIAMLSTPIVSCIKRGGAQYRHHLKKAKKQGEMPLPILPSWTLWMEGTKDGWWGFLAFSTGWVWQAITKITFSLCFMVYIQTHNTVMIDTITDFVIVCSKWIPDFSRGWYSCSILPSRGLLPDVCPCS